MVSRLSEEVRRRGVITYSSGNHAQALAYAARALNVPAVVVMPTTASAIKVEGARGYGAEILREGTTSLERRGRAEQVALERGLTIVPPFDCRFNRSMQQCPRVYPPGFDSRVSCVAAC